MADDISALYEHETFDLEVKRPDGKPVLGSDEKPWTITLAGPTTAAAYRAQEFVSERFGRLMRSALTTPTQERDEKAEADEYIERAVEPLVMRTVGWSPCMAGGKPLAFTKDAARQLYRQSDLVRRQVEVALARPGNFLTPT